MMLEEYKYYLVGKNGVLAEDDVNSLVKNVKAENVNHKFNILITEGAIIDVCKVEDYEGLHTNVYEVMVLDSGFVPAQADSRKYKKDGYRLAEPGFIVYTTDQGLFSSLTLKKLVPTEQTMQYWEDTGEL